ncbi:hypothetical protein [Solirubrobacter deserti]|uniref:hypothetical protein n=1 Tax=Solirubrobacter deserti TaxID=2282478 RepID=UPI0022CD3FB8|nr:hypothetical protein [Solirubrobacter deserti]
MAALLLVPVAAVHAQEWDPIVVDCVDDSVLQGDYSVTEMRTAINNLPAGISEYADCQDVISRAIAEKTKVTNPNPTPPPEPSPAAAAPPASRPAAASTPSPAPAAQLTGKDPGIVVGPSTEQDWRAIERANERGGDPPAIEGRPITPVASIGRNPLPESVIAVLALLAAAALAASTRILRRR